MEPPHPAILAVRIVQINLIPVVVARADYSSERSLRFLWLADGDLSLFRGETYPSIEASLRRRHRPLDRGKELGYGEDPARIFSPDRCPEISGLIPLWAPFQRGWNHGEEEERLMAVLEREADPALGERTRAWLAARGAQEDGLPAEKQNQLPCVVGEVVRKSYSAHTTFEVLSCRLPSP